MTKEEWTSIVRKHIREYGNEEILEKNKSTVRLWNNKDNVEDVALYVYADK